jgi:ABC-type transport system involved in multi-copper enzyme maturation permease subunit
MLRQIRSAFASEKLKLKRRSMVLGVFGPLIVFSMVSASFSLTRSDRAARLQALFPDEVFLTRQALSAPDGLSLMLGETATFGGFLVAAVAASVFASEYGLGTLRNLLARNPRRVPVFLGKFLGILDFLFLARALAVLASVATAYLVSFAVNIPSGRWTTGDGLVALSSTALNILLSSAAWAALGALSAVIFRTPSVAVGVVLAYALPVENLITSYWEEADRWLPGQLIRSIALGGSNISSYQRSLVLVGIYSAVAMAVSLMLFHRRDVTC